MKYALYILLALCISQAAYSQGNSRIKGGTFVHIIRAPGDTIKINFDTVGVSRQYITRLIDSIAAGISGGGRTYIKDAANLAGTVDSSGALYTLHYQIDNSLYAGHITTFANGATDSTVLFVNSGQTFLVLPDAVATFERFVAFTDVPSQLIATFDDMNSPIGIDSCIVSFHIVKRGGSKYLTVWKHKISDVLPISTISVTTPGFMVLEQMLGPTFAFKASGTATQIRWGFYWNRRRR